jgi:hypothetical protein
MSALPKRCATVTAPATAMARARTCSPIPGPRLKRTYRVQFPWPVRRARPRAAVSQREKPMSHERNVTWLRITCRQVTCPPAASRPPASSMPETLGTPQTSVANLKPTSSQPRPPFHTSSTRLFSHFLPPTPAIDKAGNTLGQMCAAALDWPGRASVSLCRALAVRSTGKNRIALQERKSGKHGCEPRFDDALIGLGGNNLPATVISPSSYLSVTHIQV